jgi:hypothetical protein
LTHCIVEHGTPASDAAATSACDDPNPKPAIPIFADSTAPQVSGTTAVTLGAPVNTTALAVAGPAPPSTAVTYTAAGPAGRAGVATVSCVGESHDSTVELTPSINTALIDPRPVPKRVPVRVTVVPPVVGTAAGFAETTTGTRYVVVAIVPADSGPAPSELLSDKVYVYAVFSSRGPGSTNKSVGAGTVTRSTPPRYTEYTVTGRFPLVAFKGSGQEIVKVPVVGKLERDTAGAGGASGTVNGCGESVIVIKVEFWISAM